MAVDFSGSTQRITAGGPGAGQSLKTYTGKQALSATLTTTINLETVTAGKNFYITDIYLSHDSNIAIDYQIQAAGVTIFRAAVKGDTAPVQMPGIETQPLSTSGQAVTLVIAAAAGPPNAFFYIAGYEQ